MPPFDLEELKEKFKQKIEKIKENINKEIRNHDIGNDYILQDVYDNIIKNNQKKLLNLLETHVNNNFNTLYNTNSMDIKTIDDNISYQLVKIHKEINDKLDLTYSKPGHISFLRSYNDELLIPTIDACVSEFLNDKTYNNKIETLEEFYVFKNEVMKTVNTTLNNFSLFLEMVRYSLLEIQPILFVHSGKVDYNKVTYNIEEEELDVALDNILNDKFPIVNSLATIYYRYSQLLTAIKIIKDDIYKILHDIDNKNNYSSTLLNLFIYFNTMLQYQCIYDSLLNSLQKIKNKYDNQVKSELSKTEIRKINELLNEIKNFDILFLRNSFHDISNKTLQLSIFIKNYIFNKVDEFLI